MYERQKSQRDPTAWTTRRLPSSWDGLGARARQKERKQQSCVETWSVETSRRQLDVQARVQRDTGLEREIWGWLTYRWHFRPGDRMRSSKKCKQKRIERRRLRSLQHFEVGEEESAKGMEKTDEWDRRKPGRVGSPGRQWVRVARRRMRDHVLRYWWESEGRTEAHDLDLDQSSCGEQWGWEPEGRGLRKKNGSRELETVSTDRSASRLAAREAKNLGSSRQRSGITRTWDKYQTNWCSWKWPRRERTDSTGE